MRNKNFHAKQFDNDTVDCSKSITVFSKKLIFKELAESKNKTPLYDRRFLGCLIKVDLDKVIYKSLPKIKQFLASYSNFGIKEREDVFSFGLAKKEHIKVSRRFYPLANFDNKKTMSQVKKDAFTDGDGGVVGLVSYCPNILEKKFFESMKNYYWGLAESKRKITVGKVHTVQLSRCPKQEFIVHDHLAYDKGGELYGVANIDAISMIDPELPYDHPISVQIAINNALNDLFCCGVYRDIVIYPLVDCGNTNIQRALKLYTKLNPNFKIDFSSLNQFDRTIPIVGATIIGLTDRELPKFSQLEPGLVLIVSRPIGDLAVFTNVFFLKATRQELGGCQKLRVSILQQLLKPNVDIAELISEYLPSKGNCFDRKRHIFTSTDISGQGIKVLEEMSARSKVDISLEQIVMHTNGLENANMFNPTAGTNGAILIAVDASLTEEIMSKLKAIGANPWIAGKVLRNSQKPRIHIRQNLSYYPFLNRESCLFKRFTYF